MSSINARRRSWRRPIATFGLATALVIGGCSDDGSPDRADPDRSDEAPTSSDEPTREPVETQEVSFDLEASAYGPVQLDVPTEPIATVPSTVQGIELEVFALQRSADGQAVTLVFAAENTTTDELGFDTTSSYSEIAGGNFVSSGLLVDVTELKAYQVFRLDGDEGACLCSEASDLFSLDAGQRLFLSAVYPAPPPATERMTLQIGMGTVPDIPVTDA